MWEGEGGEDARLKVWETGDGETHSGGGNESGCHDEERWVGDFHAGPEAGCDGDEEDGCDAVRLALVSMEGEGIRREEDRTCGR